MKAIIFLTFFVLTLFVNAQDKMGVGNDPEGVDSAGIGTITTWVKPSGWNYEGVMTVGNSNFSYGYEFGIVNYGSMSPDLPVESIENVNIAIIFTDDVYTGIVIDAYTDVNVFSNDQIILNVNNTNYIIPIDGAKGFHFLSTETNPFPGVGETCDIKLKYTLIP